MANKPTKPINHAPARKMTEQEKQARAMQFLAAKREQYAVNILNGLCTNMGKDASNVHAMLMVDLAVEMADHLLEKLYPIKEESK